MNSNVPKLENSEISYSPPTQQSPMKSLEMAWENVPNDSQ